MGGEVVRQRDLMVGYDTLPRRCRAPAVPHRCFAGIEDIVIADHIDFDEPGAGSGTVAEVSVIERAVAAGQPSLSRCHKGPARHVDWIKINLAFRGD